MKLIVIAAASAMLMAGAAQAQTRPAVPGTTYGELGYTTLKLSSGGVSVKPAMLRGIVGYNFNNNFAFEGMLGLGVSKDSTSTTFAGVPVDVQEDVRHIVGIYVKPKAVIGDAFEVFGRLGYAHTRVRTTASVPGFSASDSGSDSSVSYGIGANFNVSPKMYVGVDYMRYFKKDDTKIDGFTVGLGYRF
jgi:outer membrane autotransporter protein